MCVLFLLVAIENNSIPKITRKNNPSKINSKKIDEVRQKSQETFCKKVPKKRVCCQLSNSDSSISTNNNEENQPMRLKRPIQGYHTVRFQDNLTCEKEISVLKANSSHQQFSPRVSPKIQRVKKMAAPGLSKESKHISTRIPIIGPSPYKPFGAATPTPIVALKGYQNMKNQN
jgi:hypothetical protein